LAQKGTIFLDEIGNLSLPLQAKLLSVLQNRRVNRIGSGKEIPVDFRLICATNMPLYEMVQQGEFREDLLYRINVVEIKVPSLKERSGDIPLLVSFFMKKFTKKYNKPKLKLPQNVINLLSKYSWPGNIRELGHLIERAVILSDGIKLNFQDFASDFSNTKIQGNTEDNLNLEEMEKKHILKAISRNKGNITKAAKDLGIARTALYRRLEKYGL